MEGCEYERIDREGYENWTKWEKLRMTAVEQY